MYLDNSTEHNKHIKTLKHRNNVRLVNEELQKKGTKFECVTCKSTLSQYSVDQNLKTKMHLDNVNGKDKDIDKDKITEDNGETRSDTHDITEGCCNICNTRINVISQ